MNYIHIQGQLLPADAAVIGADDRSFRFGDGIFETLLVVNGVLYDMEAHMARLKAGLEYFRLPLDISALEQHCRELIVKNNCTSGYIRIIVSRGSAAGSMGYMPGDMKPYYVIQTMHKPYPAFGAINLCVSKQRAHMWLPCKVNSALLYTLAMMEARDKKCDNALILDIEDHVCETASGNLFWVKENVLYTPATTLPFVPGTVRKKLIATSFLPVKEGRYTLEELAGAEEIFMSNIGGLVTRITAIEEIGYVAQSDVMTARFRALIDSDITERTQAQL